MKFKFNPKVAYTLFSAIVILTGTLLAIQYAQGKYRFTNDGLSKETGLLSANSFPTGAQIYIDGKLISATDDTLYLKPGEYLVKIQKEGYHPWEKKLLIEGELVTQTNAQLYPVVPSLTPLSFTGAQNISTSPDGQKIIFYTNKASTLAKNGLYVLDLQNNLLSFQKGATQIAEDIATLSLAKADFIWSPDGDKILLLANNRALLLDVNKKNNLTVLLSLTGAQKTALLSEWEEEIYLKEKQYLAKFPETIIAIATQSARNVYFSPDKEKIIYVAEETITIPQDLIPPVLATNTQPESRTLEPNKIYIYDKEEDKNFYLGEAKDISEEMTEGEVLTQKKLLTATLINQDIFSPESSPSAFLDLQATNSAQTALNFNFYYSSLGTKTYQWLPDSRHLVMVGDNKISIKSYDNTNTTTVYSGPFADSFVYPWPDGSKLIILTSFSPDSPMNLYAVDLK